MTALYTLASEKAVEILKEISTPLESRQVLKQIAMTAMTGKGAEANKDKLSDLIVHSVDQIAEGNKIDLMDEGTDALDLL